MTAHLRADLPPGFTRFTHGELLCTVVSDGVIQLGAARDSFPNAAPSQVDELLRRHYLPTDAVYLNQNILVVEAGDTVVMFDSGVGADPELGRKTFGDQTGKTIPNLRLAGIEPEDIDVVALTHAHPDHAWGLAAADGSRLYPNAKIAVGRADYDWWTDLSRVAEQPTEHQRDQIVGAQKNLTAYEGDLILLNGGEAIAPGIRAIATPGHSPGHMVFEISSGDDTMVCWGDLCHHHVLLLEHPEWNFVFDHDGARATDQRIRMYDFVDSQRHAVFGYHFPFPGHGHLRRDLSGFTWIPSDLPRSLPDDAP
ncbi:MBL fold metallo-hydrolase [Lacisediminihabitans profunda]|uniref:MBL fold metallo-hydrolase n=1 Tax=Lacisediminihabitans profunda TaxID=2594790 RepID=A0A5C8UNI4_9MICO|nr:MBL fold metallo-hydrolase [Lacisediminihabitans profunda]TXN29471.1 MBL fold metallo-hydrolase [Lacisediminihabitans profunda]